LPARASVRAGTVGADAAADQHRLASVVDQQPHQALEAELALAVDDHRRAQRGRRQVLDRRQLLALAVAHHETLEHQRRARGTVGGDVLDVQGEAALGLGLHVEVDAHRLHPHPLRRARFVPVHVALLPAPEQLGAGGSSDVLRGGGRCVEGGGAGHAEGGEGEQQASARGCFRRRGRRLVRTRRPPR
jgi:hypothetical protein